MSDSPEKVRSGSTSSVKEVLAELGRVERTTGNSGLIPNATKSSLLDLDELRARHPDKELRFVNVANPDKVNRRTDKGWSRLSESEGGKQLGNLAVYTIPKTRVNELRFAKIKRQQELLVQFKKEDHHLAEQMSKILRDRHGLDISPERLIAE